MYYIGTECMKNQSPLFTSEESVEIDHFKERNAHTTTLFFKLKNVTTS